MDPFGCPAFGDNPVEYIDDIGTSQALTRLDRQTLPREYVNYCQRTKTLSARGLIADKIHAPGDVGRPWFCARWLPARSRDMPSWTSSPDLQAFFAIQPMNALLVDVDTLPKAFFRFIASNCKIIDGVSRSGIPAKLHNCLMHFAPDVICLHRQVQRSRGIYHQGIVASARALQFAANLSGLVTKLNYARIVPGRLRNVPGASRAQLEPDAFKNATRTIQPITPTFAIYCNFNCH